MYLNLIRIEYIRFIGLKKHPTEPKRNELNRKTGIKYHTIRHKPAWVQSASPIKVIHSETPRHPGPWRWPRTSRNQAVVAAVKGSSKVGFSGWSGYKTWSLATNSGCLPKHGKIASTVQALRRVSLRLRISLRALSILSFVGRYRNSGAWKSPVASLLCCASERLLRLGKKTQPESLGEFLLQYHEAATLQWRKKARSSLAACGASRAASPRNRRNCFSKPV